MRDRKWSRRAVLKASGALAAGTLFAEPLKAAPPAPSAVTPALIEAARKEGKVSFYSALELNVAERLGKVFEAKYPAFRCGSSVPARNGFSSALRRSRRATSTPSTSSTRPTRRIILTGRKKTGWRPICPRTSQNIPGGPDRSGRHVCDLLRLAGGDRLQHQPGEARRRAEELRRPARSEMAGQDRQGAPGL